MPWNTFSNYDVGCADEEPNRDQYSEMPQLFGKLSEAGNNPFDFQIERLIALLRLVFTSYCLVFFISEQTRQPQFDAIKLILSVHAIFGTFIVLRHFLGRLNARWQLPVHLADIVIISMLQHLLGATSTTFFILFFVLLSTQSGGIGAVHRGRPLHRGA